MLRKRIVEKLTSGQFLLTVIVGILLYKGTMGKIFDAKEVLGIARDVVIFYFVVRKRLNNPGGE